MSFLNGACVSPKLPSTNAAVETELSDSFGQEKDKAYFNYNEGKEASIIDDRGVNECQEGLDGILEEQLYNASGLFQNGKTSRPGSHCPKSLSWEAEDSSLSNKKRSRYHTCDRVILIALCLLSAASIVLTLLMLFGILAPLNCACSKKTGISILLA